MIQFVKGDKIRYKQTPRIKREVVGVLINGGIDIKTPEGNIYYNQRPDFYELDLSPEEGAIEILKAAGYSIIPPKPLLTGKIHVIQREGFLRFTDDPSGWGEGYKTIAIVEWTEGDGL